MWRGLRAHRVVDCSTGIAGAYVSKLFADAGADVIKLEGPQGDPLRRWSSHGSVPDGSDGALFRFLAAGKRSVVGAPGDGATQELLAGADLVIESYAAECPIDRRELLEGHPGLVLLSISPFGLEGPGALLPSSEFTIQAECGSTGLRGLPGQEPFQAGGRTTEWIAGVFAAVGALAAVRRAAVTGHGEHVDFSLKEVMAYGTASSLPLMWDLMGQPPLGGSAQAVETPSIEPTADGYVGFNTNSLAQYEAFLALIEREDLRGSDSFDTLPARQAHIEEWEALVHAFTRSHPTSEIVERAAALRIPVAQVLNGSNVQRHEQFAARGVFFEDPSKGFLRPRPPYKIDGAGPPTPVPAPKLGEHTGRVEARRPLRPVASGPPRLPLEGLQVVDATSWWAGPSASHMLAVLGADVVHIESTVRPDGGRNMARAFAGTHEFWWERAALYLGTNANKRGITLDLKDPRGLEWGRRLIERADVLVENFSPRVMEGFGLGWQAVHELNSRCIFVRMPAFGLDGPWRDHVGFAQTMEQVTGLAWLTGHVEDRPRIQRGPCDPISGMHGAFAALVALAERDRTGRGSLVECTMVEGALNAAAEQIIEYTAYGNLQERMGNRSPWAAPQGLYPCRGHDPVEDPRWLALSVETGAQWSALLAWLGDPEWARKLVDASLAERRAAQEEIDVHLRLHFAARERDACVEALCACGVPAAIVADPRLLREQPQLIARGFFEELDHAIVGKHRVMSLPFRYASVERWLHTAAPTMGQHNREILLALGASEQEIAALEDAGVIGTRPLDA